MINFEGKKVYLACGKTDMRKSINGLATIVESGFKLNLRKMNYPLNKPLKN